MSHLDVVVAFAHHLLSIIWLLRSGDCIVIVLCLVVGPSARQTVMLRLLRWLLDPSDAASLC